MFVCYTCKGTNNMIKVDAFFTICNKKRRNLFSVSPFLCNFTKNKKQKLMIDYLAQNLWTLWAVLAMVCLVLELSSGDFYITCFGIGAVCALVASLFALPFWAQVVIFAVFSVLSIYCIRPHLVHMLDAKGGQRKSNADAIIGRVGKVTETIKAGDYGRMKLDGDDWKAESDETEDLPVGTKVRIIGRESIIVKVEKA